jgi:hypothetical protein
MDFFFLTLFIFAFAPETNAALFFKQHRYQDAAKSGLERDTAALSVLRITTPPRLPKLHEEIIFDVPMRADPLTLRVDRVYEHPATRSSTVCGHIIDTSATSSGGNAGTFTLACQAPVAVPAGSAASLDCVANLRPTNSGHVQYELRPDVETKAHRLAAVNTMEVYEPKVLESHKARRLLNANRPFIHSPSSQIDADAPQQQPEQQQMSRSLLSTDTNDIMDLFVVWTPEAEAVAGGANAMDLYMQFVVDEANYVLETSQVELRLRIKTAMRTIDGSYTEPGGSLGDILYQATDYSADGEPEFDTEQGLRYTDQADALVVISGSEAGGQCGIAWVRSE